MEKKSEINFSNFVFEKIINQDNNSKVLTLLGSFKNMEGKAIVVLMKNSFDEKADWTNILNFLKFQNTTDDNDVYKNLSS